MTTADLPPAEHVFSAGFLYCGLGAGALGFLQASAKLGKDQGRFVNLGGIDNDPAACADFEYLTGSKATCADVGGESGPKARPFNVAWARSIVNRCRSAGVPCFVKQLGANTRTRNDDGLISDFSEGGWFLNADWQIEDDVHGFREQHQGAEVRVLLRHRAGADPEEWPEDLRVRQFPEVRR